MINKYFKNSKLERTEKVKINTVLSLFFRSGSIFLSFILVPLTIDYIKPDIYGVWLTLSSLVGWIAMLDIGIANGLKNKLSESLAEKNYVQGKMYVSTMYIITGLIAFGLVGVYLIFYQHVNWQSVFNSPFISEKKLRDMVSIVVILFLLKFISDIINVVAAAFQMVAVSSFLLFLSNLGITLSVWILTKSTVSNLVLLAICLSLIPFLVSVIASFVLFNTRFKSIKPSLEKVNFNSSKGILSLGWQFFVLQIVVVIIFQTDNIIISQFFEPREVTNFNVAYKYYSIIVIIFTVLLTPYWTAFTEAFIKKDFYWINKSINRLIIYWTISIAILILMFLVSSWIIKLWLGDSVLIPIPLSLSICAYVAVTNWNAIFANFLNGIGKIRVQILFAVIMGILNIPLCLVFVKFFKFGTFSMPLSNFICLLIGSLISFIQYKKIINNNANGIWDK